MHPIASLSYTDLSSNLTHSKNSALFVVPHTQGAQVRITVLPANYTVPASTS